MIRNPLNRRMFTTPQQRRGMARMPQGILASGPRIMNAAMNQFGADNSIVTIPDIGGPIRQDGIVTIPEVVLPDTQGALPNSQNTPQGSPPVVGGEDNIGNLDDVAPDNQPAPIPSPPKPKPSKQEVQEIIEAREEANKPSSEQTMESIMDKIAKLRGTADEKKTKKQALDEAKQFLKDAGVDNVDDIRTSRDFMLMTLGLNIAAGGSDRALDNIIAGSKETLGTFGALKAKEKEAERSINLAAAEMAKAEITSQQERGLKASELEIEALTSQLEQQIKAELGPDELQIARALQKSNPELTLEQAIRLTKTPASSNFKSRVLDTLFNQFPNADRGIITLLVAQGTAMKTFLEEEGFEGLARVLGVSTDEAKKIAEAAGQAADLPDSDAEVSEEGGTSVIKLM
jgi:hypothetical protein